MSKRFVFFYAVLTVILVGISIFFAYKLDKAKKIEKEEVEEKKKQAEITKYIKQNKVVDKIKLKRSATGEIKELSVDEYIQGVLPAEMPPEYDLEALKAQAIVARTYLFNKMKTNAHKDADICDSPSHCQAYYAKEDLFRIWKNSKKYTQEDCEKYYKKIKEAVGDTKNIVVTYNGEYIKAYFHACSGGKTEDVSQIWGKQDIPYLKSVESIENESYKNYTSKVKLTLSKLEEKLNKDETTKCSIDSEEEIVKILSYTKTGRVDKVKIGGSIYSAEKLRTLLGLRSTNFTVECKNKEVVFNVIGNGHGVGMSQVGADYYAKQGYTFTQIILHYYTGVDVTYLYEEEKTNENKI